MKHPQYLKIKILSLIVLLSSGLSINAQTQVHGLVQARYVAGDREPSFINRGTGLFRHDDDSNFEVAHALLELKSDLADKLTLHAVLNHTQSPESFTSFTQLSLRYKPIWSAKYRWQFKAGMFYPEFGFENPDMAWMSPYNYTHSAISSWIGEEMRTIGGEFKVTRPGRAHGASPHTFSLVGSVFKGNDTTGTILAWRGWGLHDKQALFKETIFFAEYPSLDPGQELEAQAAWVEPFREVDGRFGYYVGGHWDYQKKSRVRYYYYNNNADELVLARRGQYAWHTRFHSLSWQYRFNKEWRLISHYMNGDTAMGPGAVNVDFSAWYMMFSYKTGAHRLSARIDDFETIDRDASQEIDNNDGNGSAFTASYRYTINANWQLGTQYIRAHSFQANRAQFPGLVTDIDQNQVMGVLQYRF